MSERIGHIAMERFCNDLITHITFGHEFAEFYQEHTDTVLYMPFYAIWQFHYYFRIKSAHLYVIEDDDVTHFTSDYVRLTERITLDIPQEYFEFPGSKVLIIVDPRTYRMPTISLMYALERVHLGLDGIGIIAPQSFPIRDDTIVAQYYEYNPRRTVRANGFTVTCESFLAELEALKTDLCDILDAIAVYRREESESIEEGDIELAEHFRAIIDALMRRLSSLTSVYINRLRTASRSCMDVVLKYNAGYQCREEWRIEGMTLRRR
ncbi:MAG: hypothetical protein DRH44_04500 [Candidatus Coatesbacteria bacterium]|nr:MAG: hypothetical protein DRH49_02700 [Candidatus Coatesbacteria bacterium]RLC43658.1 MAG: hypothetical protein DRH44_04500 [Candidatus Coatesbacteria bacterium]